MLTMRKLLLRACLLPGCVLAVATAASTPLEQQPSPGAQNHAYIMNVVDDFMRQQTAVLPGKASYRIDNMDQRIRLAQCDQIEAFLPVGSQLIGKTSVGVRCTKTNGWRVLVPVHIRMSINLLISARQLPSGHIVQSGDLASRTIDASRIEGLTDPKQALGQVLRHGIGAGQVLRENMLRPPYSVIQGHAVQLAVQGNGFSIGSEGVALNNAGDGQAVRVRVGSKRVIGGIARANGTIAVEP